MLQAFTELRTLAVLRRIAKAMERANELELHRQEIEHPPLKEGRPEPRKAVFSKAANVERESYR
jgi:hypothetical protein